jgi:soluble lytic murein transglycosylase-like protein
MAQGEMKSSYLPSEIMEMAAKIRLGGGPDVPADLVAAIAMAESSGDPWAVRYEPKFRWLTDLAQRPFACTHFTEEHLQKCSWGLMQIMGATARQIGFRGWITELLAPETNVLFGMRYLATLRDRYECRTNVIAAYNAGSPIAGEDGRYKNQPYVDRVLAVLDELQSAGEAAGEEEG